MSGIAPVLHKISSWDPISPEHVFGGSADIGYDILKRKAAPVVNAPPNVSTAANLAQQQNDLRQRQRGVLSNIFAGNNNGGNAAPAVATGTVLGG